MDITTWIPAATTTAIFGAILWFARSLIRAYVTQSVKHDYDKRLQGVQAELRASEERLKAQLREREAEIAALRGGALSILASRQTAVDQRRLQAVDQVWSAYITLAPARNLVRSLAVIHYENALAEAGKNPRMRAFVEFLGAGVNLDEIKTINAALARPYLTPMVWAVFSAVSAIVAHSVTRLEALKTGVATDSFINQEAIGRVIAAALPDYDDTYARNGPTDYPRVLDALEEKLLAEIQNMLSGKDDDRRSIEQASEIVRQVKALNDSAENPRGPEMG